MMGGLEPLAVHAAAVVLGFLSGSVPVGLVLLRLSGGPDPRSVGSRNIGATNVTRAGGRGLGAATLILDMAKAFAPAIAFGVLGPLPAALAGGAAIVGHCFTPWLGFQGGKGVSCLLGAALALAWPFGPLVFVAVWGLGALLTRIVSVASLAATWATLAVTWWTGEPVSAVLALAVGALVVTLRHRTNLRRLVQGREPRLPRRRATT